MPRFVLGKDTFYASFPLWPTSLSFVVAQPDERLANRTPKELSVGVDKEALVAWPNKRTNDNQPDFKTTLVLRKILKEFF